MLLSLLLAPPLLADTCDAYGEPTALFSSEMVPSDESSGLAASRVHPGAFFTHDDSGGRTAIFGFDEDGGWLGTWDLEGAGFVDWEDMAAGPCPWSDGACLYIGDIGDNFHFRAFVTVWVVEEPTGTLDPAAPVEGVLPVVAAARLTWPDEVRDSETLMVHPLTGRIYLVSKEFEGDSIIVAADPDVLLPPAEAEAAEPSPLALVAPLDLSSPAIGDPLTTGGDWERDGDRVVIRTYGAAWEWATDPCDPDAHWGDAPVGMSLAGEPQGEAIAYSLDGDLVTTSEGAPLAARRLPCLAPGPGADPCPPPADSGEGSDSGTGTGKACRGCAKAALLLPLAVGTLRRRRHPRAARRPEARPVERIPAPSGMLRGIAEVR